MVQITHFLATLIFMMYRDRFGAYDFEEMEIGTETLLPHGVKLLKSDENKYQIKYYAQNMVDWYLFKEGIKVRMIEIIDAHTQILPKREPSDDAVK